ncbi:hypothetical protein, partial [Haloparvum sp. AD34]
MTKLPTDGVCPQCNGGPIEGTSVYDDYFKCENCYTYMTKLPSDGVCPQCNGGPIEGTSVYDDYFKCE